MTPEEELAQIKTVFRLRADTDTLNGLHERLLEYKHGFTFTHPETILRVCNQCLASPNPLTAFAVFYTTWLNGNLQFCQHFGVHETKVGMGLTVFRSPPFQVQLFLFRAGAVIMPHGHPDVESFEVYICGDMTLTKEGMTVSDRANSFPIDDGQGGHRCSCNGGMVHIPAGLVHGGWMNSSGSFMSIQYWLNGKQPESIQYNWEGKDGSLKG